MTQIFELALFFCNAVSFFFLKMEDFPTSKEKTSSIITGNKGVTMSSDGGSLRAEGPDKMITKWLFVWILTTQSYI
jgi:hypothetical protein